MEIQRPFLGICLGHQLLADALGGTCGHRRPAQIGICEIELKAEGRGDPLFAGLLFKWLAACGKGKLAMRNVSVSIPAIVLTILSTPAAAETHQCVWYPFTCLNGVVTVPVEPTCLKDAICDQTGREYTDVNWPATDEELEKVCARYVKQHGYGQDSICGD